MSKPLSVPWGVERWKITSSMGVQVAAHWLVFGPDVSLSADYALGNSVGAIGSSVARSVLVSKPSPRVLERVELALPTFVTILRPSGAGRRAFALSGAR